MIRLRRKPQPRREHESVLPDYSEAREILRRLDLGQTAQMSDMAEWADTHLTGEERNDDE